MVDDRPVAWRDFARELARVTGAPAPASLPLWLCRLVAPYGTRFLATRLPVSNARARQELAWTPAFPTYRDGLAGISATPARG